jgi:DNA-binding NarL/FixJ family response regulator
VNYNFKIILSLNHSVSREHFTRYISGTSTFRIVANAKSIYECIMLVAVNRPDLMLLEVEEENAPPYLDALLEITNQFPDIKIIIFIENINEDIVFSAFQNGATDFILGNSTKEETLSVFQDAIQNNSQIRPIIADRVRSELKKHKIRDQLFQEKFPLLSKLTDTELELIYFFSLGKTRAEICKIKCVELSTIKTEIHNMLKKFNERSISDLMKLLNSINFFDLLQNFNYIRKFSDANCISAISPDCLLQNNLTWNN